jgi:hypothetical protein
MVDDEDPGITGQSIWYADADTDNYGDPATSQLACYQPDGYLPDNTDCNDSDSAIRPGAAEICDGTDNDCNAGTGDGIGESWYGGICDGADADLCEEGSYECINGTQSCSDVTSDTAEICSDGIDNDCDGSVDEPNISEPLVVNVYPVADTSVRSGSPSANYGTELTLEVDGSPTRISYLLFDVTGISGTVQSARLSLDVVNQSSSGGTVHFISNNSWDENAATFDTRPDIDGPALDTAGAVAVGDILEFDVTPAVGGNGVYSFAIVPNSNNRVEYRSREDSINPPVLIITTQGEGAPFYCDDDSDGYIDSTSDGGYTENGCKPAGCQTEAGIDCDDTNGGIKPGAVEICDGMDNNCDGLIDDNDPGITGQSIWYADTDTDNYGDANTSLLACSQPDGYLSDNSDCNDSDSAISPGAVEICDGIDNDCSAGTGDGSGEGWYGGSCDGADADLCQEGIYECISGTQSCSDLTGDKGEVCSDGIDNDCDETVDELNVPEPLVVNLYPIADTSVDSQSPSSNYGTDVELERRFSNEDYLPSV